MLPFSLLLKVTFSISEATTLADLLALRLHQVEDAVRSIVDKAVKELGTEKVGSLGLFLSTLGSLCTLACQTTRGGVHAVVVWRQESQLVPHC